ncbi:hypothetical protein Ciccas_011149 [Cichlidogyrus casuarinus]|uniref:TOG domain-containing protein n=1 Tax=Cichlidogyrus casuarinus TaxID=1844966 RepID=A0ABD2PU44_9PLAT
MDLRRLPELKNRHVVELEAQALSDVDLISRQLNDSHFLISLTSSEVLRLFEHVQNCVQFTDHASAKLLLLQLINQYISSQETLLAFETILPLCLQTLAEFLVSKNPVIRQKSILITQSALRLPLHFNVLSYLLNYGFSPQQFSSAYNFIVTLPLLFINLSGEHRTEGLKICIQGLNNYSSRIHVASNPNLSDICKNVINVLKKLQAPISSKTHIKVTPTPKVDNVLVTSVEESSSTLEELTKMCLQDPAIQWELLERLTKIVNEGRYTRSNVQTKLQFDSRVEYSQLLTSLIHLAQDQTLISNTSNSSVTVNIKALDLLLVVLEAMPTEALNKNWVSVSGMMLKLSLCRIDVSQCRLQIHKILSQIMTRMGALRSLEMMAGYLNYPRLLIKQQAIDVINALLLVNQSSINVKKIEFTSSFCESIITALKDQSKQLRSCALECLALVHEISRNSSTLTSKNGSYSLLASGYARPLIFNLFQASFPKSWKPDEHALIWQKMTRRFMRKTHARLGTNSLVEYPQAPVIEAASSREVPATTLKTFDMPSEVRNQALTRR